MCFYFPADDGETFWCPNVSGELIPPMRSQDSKQSGFYRVISSKWRSHKSICCCQAEWTGWDVRLEHIPDVDGARTARSTLRKNQYFEANAGSHRSSVGEFRLKTSQAAAFWMSCRGRMALAGRPARIELQKSRHETTRAWTRTCAAFCVRRGRVLLMLCNMYLQECVSQ